MGGRRRRIKDALERIERAAELAVAQGQYPTVELALYEMAANQRRAVRLGVDIHNLIKQHESER